MYKDSVYVERRRQFCAIVAATQFLVLASVLLSDDGRVVRVVTRSAQSPDMYNIPYIFEIWSPLNVKQIVIFYIFLET